MLVDALLLARAAFLLKSVSAVGEFAIYWSEAGRFFERSYDFNLQTRQPMPRWVGALAGAGEGAQQSYTRDESSNSSGLVALSIALSGAFGLRGAPCGRPARCDFPRDAAPPPHRRADTPVQ